MEGNDLWRICAVAILQVKALNIVGVDIECAITLVDPVGRCDESCHRRSQVNLVAVYVHGVPRSWHRANCKAELAALFEISAVVSVDCRCRYCVGGAFCTFVIAGLVAGLAAGAAGTASKAQG